MEEENRQLKQLVADLSLDKQMLQDLLKKSIKASPVEKAGLKFNGKLSGFGSPCLRCNSVPLMLFAV
ncbi:hypothetical protein GCM10028807_14330 [Spirosoma daeguense]